MDEARLLRKYSRSNDFWTSLVYNFLLTDGYLRNAFIFGPQCGAITVITGFLIVLVLAYTTTSWSLFLTNVKKFKELGEDSIKKLPRRESVLQVEPGYDIINEHLQQVGTYLERTKKVVNKEQMVMEVLNSRINSIVELVHPTEQPQWNRARTPKGSYYREKTPVTKIAT